MFDASFVIVNSAYTSPDHTTSSCIVKLIDIYRHMIVAAAANSDLRNSGFFKRPVSTKDKVMNAELLMTSFLIEHNLPISLADHFTCLMPAMFPNSEIANKFASSRTKTTYLVRELGKTVQEDILDSIRDKFNQCGFFFVAAQADRN